jgi:hypothetical protein
MLGSYNFIIIHRLGKDNMKTDLLSRCLDYLLGRNSTEKQPNSLLLKSGQLSAQVTTLEETTLQRDDEFIRQLREAYEKDSTCQKALELARDDQQGNQGHEWFLSEKGLLLIKELIFVPNLREL